MGLDIYFFRRKNTNAKIERALDKFWGLFDEDAPADEARRIADGLGIANRLDISEKAFKSVVGGVEKTVKYTTAHRNDSEEAAYFRKHNHLLPYFGYGENCTNLTVTRKALQKFVSDAKKVLRHWGKPDFEKVAKEAMPTCVGFFYGSYDYDDWYRQKLEDEVRQLSEVIKSTDFRKDRIVMHCWW